MLKFMTIIPQAPPELKLVIIPTVLGFGIVVGESQLVIQQDLSERESVIILHRAL